MIDLLLIWLNRVFAINPVAPAIMAVGLALAFWARRRVDGAFERGAKLASKLWTTGAEAATEILAATGLEGVSVARARGPFADYYDPETRTIRLSSSAHDGQSLTAVGLAAHEAGHALQDARRDPPMPLFVRDGLAQSARLGPASALLAAAAGFLLDAPSLLHGGMVIFTLLVALPLLGLPIERDASRRARRALAMTALVDSGQDEALASILDAATWITLASTLPRLRSPAWRRLAPDASPIADRDTGPVAAL